VAQLAQGETGARAYLRANPEVVIEVACDETGSPADVDTPGDLAALQDH
jgi:CTP:molybdopterin cytidylyltransferase MocA